MRTLKIFSLLASALLLFMLGGCGWFFNKPPVAEFTWEPLQPMAGEEITFDASSSYDPEDCTLQYQWNFGDGTTASGKVVKHVFIDDGVYSVTLIVTDKWGKTDKKVQTVNVLNPPPDVNQISIKDQNGGRIEAGDILIFNVSALDPASIGLKYIASYHWDFGDGTQKEGKIVSHRYDCAGTYIVTVTVSDDDGASTSYSCYVRVYPKDRPPIADFTFKIKDGVLRTQNKSRDNDLACIDGSRIWKYWITRVFWRLYLNNRLIFSTSCYNFTYELPQTGFYKLVLQVEDDEGNITTKIVKFFYP